MFPIHVHLPFLDRTLYFYEGVYFAIAIICGYFLATKYLAKSDLPKDEWMTLLLVALCGGVFGGRAFHQLFYESGFGLDNVLAIFQVWKGGLSITGAVVIGPIITYLYCRKRKFDFWKLFALVTPAVLVSQAVGRFGCFLNGDAFGTKTESVFGVRFPRYGFLVNEGSFLEELNRSSDAWKYSLKNGWVEFESMVSASLHPAQLYEAFADLVLFVAVLYVLKLTFRKQLDFKIIPMMYVGGYSLIRFLLEFTRADRMMQVGDMLSDMQVVLLFTTFIGSFLAIRFY